jgi:lipid II:glycine glycyltransferase (peptidoglycan interpeptide bridge formation enzyme)
MIKTLHHGFISEIWHSKSIELKDIFRPTSYINYIGPRTILHFFFIRKKIYTYITNLEEEEDIIWQKIRKNVKYEINKGQKEKLVIDYFEKQNQSEFIRLYNIFALKKGLHSISQTNFNKYPTDTIFISKISLVNEPLSYHVYLHDNQNSIIRLMYSITNLEIEIDNEKSKQIGVANKYLHWQDIRFFKKNGIKTYDWGGIAKETTNQNLNGINNFKISFGGYEKMYYNYTSISYLILKFLKALIK